ncbi:hypothetical protein [Mycolicibacterium fortuitum]|uniref:hypothetical protein n=1 Tax=Mycolicibacterium fortuitum TaxID=1766 RepID=UPI0026188E88|nr:hypothetical protein [Mycolicibacterium fortuitum]
MSTQTGEILRNGNLYATVLPYSTQGHGIHADSYRWAVYVDSEHGPALYDDGVKYFRDRPDVAESEARRAAMESFRTWDRRINGDRAQGESPR